MRNKMILMASVFILGVISIRTGLYLLPTGSDGTVQLVKFLFLTGFLSCAVSGIWMILATAIKAGVRG